MPDAYDLNTAPRFVTFIAPQEYNAQRFSLADCRRLLDNAQVHSRGWAFPYIEQERVAAGPGGEFLAGSCNFNTYVAHAEEWRFWRSGQFMFRSMLWEAADSAFQEHARRDASRWWGPRRDLSDVKAFIDFRFVIALIAEAYMFASRLAASDEVGSALDIEVGFRGVLHYALASNEFGTRLHGLYMPAFDAPVDRSTVAIDTLVGDPLKAALPATHNIFEQFGWADMVPSVIAQHQRTVLRM